MLVVLAALRAVHVGVCPDTYPIPSFANSLEFCRSTDVPCGSGSADCNNTFYAGQDVCLVSRENPCCYIQQISIVDHSGLVRATSCVNMQKESCKPWDGTKGLTYYEEGTIQWCPSPEEPADDGISEALIAVIVFVSLVAVAGAAGAYAVCRM